MAVHIAVFNHSPNLLHLFRTVLSQQGYEVSTHKESEEGLLEAKDLNPDLIILGNVRGVGENDLKFYSMIRSLPETQSTPVIFATTGADFLRESQWFQSQANTHLLSKPFDLSQLRDSVSEALRKRDQVG